MTLLVKPPKALDDICQCYLLAGASLLQALASFVGIAQAVCPRVSYSTEILFAPQVEDVQVEVAMQWCSQSFSENLVGFVNSVKTIDGGTHLEGLKSAATRLVNNLGRKTKALKEGDPNLSGDHVREGLSAIISVKVSSLC